MKFDDLAEFHPEQDGYAARLSARPDQESGRCWWPRNIPVACAGIPSARRKPTALLRIAN